MNLSMGNKNVVVGLVVLMLYLSMSFFIERTSAMHQFHEKAAAVVVDTKGSSSLLDHQVVDVKRGPAYRKGGIFFTNYYPASYVRVPNSVREAGYNMRWYAWWFALFNIVVGIIVGIQKQANLRLRTWASWLAIVGCVALSPSRHDQLLGALLESPVFSGRDRAGALPLDGDRRNSHRGRIVAVARGLCAGCASGKPPIRYEMGAETEIRLLPLGAYAMPFLALDEFDLW